jgi:surface antigen
VVTREASAPTPELTELKAKLDGSDRQAAAQALQLALNELGDGVTLVWRRPAHGLEGRVKPVSAFRDDRGRVCRHLVYALSLGGYRSEIEGDACREPDGSWSLSG